MSTTTTTFVTTDPAGYEQFMGRWSQRLAPSFVEFARVQANEQVLDVGCGTGSLTLALAAAGVAAAVGVDPSSPYVEFARTRTTSLVVRFDVGDGTTLPYGDGTFDRSLSMLVLDVVPDPAQVVAEMRRVTRPGGTVAGLVNDFRCGYPAFTMLWDTAAVLDPGFGQLRDHLVAKRTGWPGGLAELWRATGLTAIQEARLSIAFAYSSFADYWGTFTTGQGKTGGHLMSLPEPKQREIEQTCERHTIAGSLMARARSPQRSGRSAASCLEPVGAALDRDGRPATGRGKAGFVEAAEEQWWISRQKLGRPGRREAGRRSCRPRSPGPRGRGRRPEEAGPGCVLRRRRRSSFLGLVGATS